MQVIAASSWDMMVAPLNLLKQSMHAYMPYGSMAYTMLSVTNKTALPSLTLAFTTTCKDLIIFRLLCTDHSCFCDSDSGASDPKVSRRSSLLPVQCTQTSVDQHCQLIVETSSSFNVASRSCHECCITRPYEDAQNRLVE